MNEYRLEDIEVTVVKRDKTTGQVLQFRFPNVASLSITADINSPERWDDGFASYTIQPSVQRMLFDGVALRDDVEGLIMEVREIVSARPKRKRKK